MTPAKQFLGLMVPTLAAVFVSLPFACQLYLVVNNIIQQYFIAYS